jgi:hypothetical protein
MSDLPPELDFGPSCDDVAERLRSLTYFNTVQPYVAAVLAIEDGTALPPAAYVSVTSETAEPNRLIGGHGQRVTVSFSILFCIRAENASGNVDDALDRTRRAVIRLMLGWAPPGAEKALDFSRYQIRSTGDGLVWAEAIFTTSYRLDLL